MELLLLNLYINWFRANMERNSPKNIHFFVLQIVISIVVLLVFNTLDTNEL